MLSSLESLLVGPSSFPKLKEEELMGLRIGVWFQKCLLKQGVFGTFEVGVGVFVWGKELLELDIFV